MSDWKQIMADAAVAAGLSPVVDRFFFLRHGETEYNRRHIVQGWADIPLNFTGEQQAIAAAGVLKNAGITSIITSPLGRARRTAEIISAATSTPIHQLDARLREKGFGEYEHHPDPTPGVWTRQDRNAETYTDFANRIVAGVNDATKQGLPLIVAHGGSRRIMLWALGLDVTGPAMGNAVPLELIRTNGKWNVNVLASLPGNADTSTP